jgi:iron complex outermembrane receptor protein
LLGGAMTMDYEIPGGYSFKAISSYRWAKYGNIQEEDYTPVFIAISDVAGEESHYIQEVRLTSPLFEKFNFLLGMFYLYQKNESTRSATFGPETSIPDYHVETWGEVMTNSFSGYLNGNLHLTNMLTLTAGLRYTYETKKINYNIHNSPAPIILIDLKDFTDDYSDGVFSPRAGINLSVSDNMMLYSIMSRAFKSGGWNADFLSSSEQLRFNPEFATNYELGLKSTMWNNRFRLNAAAYITKFTDYQESQYRFLSGKTHIILTNAGKVTTKGFELEFSALPLTGLTITGGIGYTNAKYDEFKNGGGEGIHYDGHKLIHAPEIEYNIAVDFYQPIFQIGNIVFHGDMSYIDDFYCNANNDAENYMVDGYNLYYIRVGFESKHRIWGIYLWSKNLSNKLYMTHKQPNFLQTSYIAWYAMPRTYGIQLNYNFLLL